MMKYYYEAEAFLKDIISHYSIADSKKLTEIKNYIVVGELEIAYEGAMLCFMDQEVQFTADEKKRIITYAEILRLNDETVIDANFWLKLNRFLFR